MKKSTAIEKLITYGDDVADSYRAYVRENPGATSWTCFSANDWDRLVDQVKKSVPQPSVKSERVRQLENTVRSLILSGDVVSARYTHSVGGALTSVARWRSGVQRAKRVLNAGGSK